ncbi:101aa long hypothetical protein [Pyrococcus horikoshii OT3]|uniref:Uncharacterized protein n=1 Tax=Pyrococcus horikoshii (strain ATCC 700860 / DSM 12428 / JCM 9974 / NBRC 100139 / OT-3) TaxID=70601 RepID=O59409_PYRHO|nr:101aa long hypothetical protein [Pyrococcus horikoshii OT3]
MFSPVFGSLDENHPSTLRGINISGANFPFPLSFIPSGSPEYFHSAFITLNVTPEKVISPSGLVSHSQLCVPSLHVPCWGTRTFLSLHALHKAKLTMAAQPM